MKYCFSQNLSFTGFVKSAEDRDLLEGVNILIDSNYVIYTDANGYFHINLDSGIHYIQYRYLGYKLIYDTINLNRDIQNEIFLFDAFIKIGDILIKGIKQEENDGVGKFTLDERDLFRVPRFMGDADPVRIITSVAGVKQSDKGGFNVRGGNIDQNLISLDGATVYNPSHLAGFFSVFNENQIDEVILSKSMFSSSIGGRLSSYLEVKSKVGDFQKWKSNIGLGLLSSSISIQGPIIKEKLSINASTRLSYIEKLVKPSIINYLGENTRKSISNVSYDFNDFNLRLDYHLDNKSKLGLTYYRGGDDFRYFDPNVLSRFNINWENQVGVINFNKELSNNKSFKIKTYYSGYYLNTLGNQSQYEYQMNSQVNDYALSFQMDIYKKFHEYSYGYNVVFHQFMPSSKTLESDDFSFNLGYEEFYNGIDHSIFFEDNIKLSSKSDLNIGLRLNQFSQIGPYVYDSINAQGILLKRYSFDAFDFVKGYLNTGGVIGYSYSFNSYSNFVLAFDRTYQNIHLATVPSVTFPIDFWIPSTYLIRPQSANQISTGYNLKYNSIKTGVEVYYKKMYNLVELANGIFDAYFQEGVDRTIIQGEGISYGYEYQLNYITDKYYIMGSYMWSKTQKSFEQINNGEYFFAKYDRRHDLSLLFDRKISNRWNLSSSFTFKTGAALTIPIGRYIVNGVVMNEYGEINSFRLPSYHRLDFGLTYTGKSKNYAQNVWSFSVFNLYNRLNPYFIFYQITGDIKSYQLDIESTQVGLMPILPSIKYELKLK